jgi:1-acyl-sn-glycerol-3-phosphate acyltransferase
MSENRAHVISLKICAWYFRFFLNIMNICVDVRGYNRIDKKNNYILVANHLSYIDVFIIGSLFDTKFVAAVEMTYPPIIGTIPRSCRHILIERNNFTLKHLKKTLFKMNETLRKGFNVALFPETRTTDGVMMLPFKPLLFKCAVTSGKNVIPLCIKYREINNRTISPKNRDMVLWYGDMTFFSHLLRLCSLKSVKAEVTVMEEIKSIDFSVSDLSRKAFETIRKEYEEIGSVLSQG